MRERHKEKLNERLRTKEKPKTSDEIYDASDELANYQYEKELDYPEEPQPISFQFSRKVKQTLFGVGAICAAVAVGVWALSTPVGDVTPSEQQQQVFENNKLELNAASAADWRSIATPLSEGAEPEQVAKVLEQRVAEGEFQPDHDDGVQTKQLVEDVRAGTMEVREMSFFDSEAEDGDVLQIEINGAVFTVPIWHTPTSVLFPFNPTGPNQMKITGVVDGGGGVTLGVIAQGQGIPLPYLTTGEHLTLNVR